MKALISSAASGVTIPLEFAWIEEDEFGALVSMTTIDGLSFACRSAACAPPNKKGTGGTGGSNPSGTPGYGGAGGVISAVPPGVGRQFLAKPGAIGEAEMVKHLANMRKNAAKSLKDDFSEDGHELSEAELASVNKRLKAQGSSLADWDQNSRAAVKLILEKFPEEGKEALLWYPRMNDWAGKISERTGISKNQILAGAALTSTLKKWNDNQKVVERIIKIYEDDKPFTLTQGMVDSYNAYTAKAKMGAPVLKPGTYKPSDMSSATLARLMSVNPRNKKIIGAEAFLDSDLDNPYYAIGGKYYTTGLAKAMAVLRGEISPDQVVSGPKQLNFYMNLAHPELTSGITHDIWQARTYYGTGKLNLPGFDTPVTMREWEKFQKNDPEGKGLQANEGLSGNTYKAATGMVQKILTDFKASNPEMFGSATGNGMQAFLWVGYQELYKAGLV